MKLVHILGAVVLGVGIALIEEGAYNELTQKEYGLSVWSLLLAIGFATLVAGSALLLSSK